VIIVTVTHVHVHVHVGLLLLLLLHFSMPNSRIKSLYLMNYLRPVNKQHSNTRIGVLFTFANNMQNSTLISYTR